MKKIIISTLAISALLFTTSCEDDFDQDVNDVVVTSGEANFSRYVALGNSLTSGYRDGALYSEGQNESYPSIIAQQMKLAGGGDFKQPLMPNNTGGFNNLPGFPGKLTLKVVNGSLTPVAGTPGGALDNVASGRPYQNMGVPGAKSFHLVAPGYGSLAGLATGTANPYFVRFASSATTSVLVDAISQAPTFFSLWIGNNDVLSYATNGGTNSQTVGGVTTYTAATVQPDTASPATYRSNDISNPNIVAGSIKAVLDGLKGAGVTKGVIANIPDVTNIPFFTRVSYNAIPLDAAKAQALNTQLYGPLKAVLTAYGQGSRINPVVAGNNPVLIIDNKLADLSAQLTAALAANGYTPTQAAFIGNAFGRARQAKQGELMLLTSSSLLGLDATTNQPATPSSLFIYGASFPIGDQYSLTADEVNNISTAVTAYNTSIRSMADSYGLAFVDMNKKMVELNSKSGITYNGVKYTATFVSGGTFSLDGVHLTGRGYAIVANEFIKSINTKYRSNLPQVDANKYSGVTFP